MIILGTCLVMSNFFASYPGKRPIWLTVQNSVKIFWSLSLGYYSASSCEGGLAHSGGCDVTPGVLGTPKIDARTRVSSMEPLLDPHGELAESLPLSGLYASRHIIEL